MPFRTLQFDPLVGPLIQVAIAFPDSLHLDPNSSPQQENINMLIDSGASWTSINPDIAARLSLPILGMRDIVSVTETREVSEYLADMHVPMMDPPYHLRDLRLIEFPMGGGQIGGLLGRDLLRFGFFQMDGLNETYTLGF